MQTPTSSNGLSTRGSRGKVRDQSLLDLLETMPMEGYEANVWRSIRAGSNPLLCSRSGGRWDDSTFDVLYTSETQEAAIAERRFHLYQGQPFPPSKVRYELYELTVSLKAVMNFASLETLANVGLPVKEYGRLSYLEREHEYPKSQEISEACAFLGADGIRVPCARDVNHANLIVFCEAVTEPEISLAHRHGVVDFT